MKLNQALGLALLSVTVTVVSANAAEPAEPRVAKKVVVAVKTDDVDLHELDISHLQPGDAETIFTEDGKTIDVLRTEDDVEIYINGKLLDIGTMAAGQHGVAHRVHKQIEINCDDDTDCDELVWLGHDADIDPDQLQGEEKVYIIKKEVITH